LTLNLNCDGRDHVREARMGARTHLATLPGSGPGQRLDVSLVQKRDGRLSIDLREQHYAAGIGWFDQKSLELDPRQLRLLQAILGEARDALQGEAEEPRMILAFPGPASDEPRRPAVGEG
jgi:hypothetical protein